MAAAMLDDTEKLEFEEFETADVEIVDSFDSMGLKDELLRGIYAYGACAAGGDCIPESHTRTLAATTQPGRARSRCGSCA
jgi:hypothetical protein